jgi:hypothetical protein
LIEAGADLVIINRFGTLEAGGQGLVDEMALAMACFGLGGKGRSSPVLNCGAPCECGGGRSLGAESGYRPRTAVVPHF